MNLFLTTMCGKGTKVEDVIEMTKPILDHIDGIVAVTHDIPYHDPVARYLNSFRGKGKIIDREWPGGRHFHSMNETLYSGCIEEGDFLLWADILEHPKPAFLSRIKTEIVPLMNESELDIIAYYGKAYLIRYKESLQYQNSPHWSLHGHNGRGIEWSTIEPDESKVRQNMRPIKRGHIPFHWCKHYLRYFLEYPVGSNSAALGLDQWPGGATQENWKKREAARLMFRNEMKRRGWPVTAEGFIEMCKAGVDEPLKALLRSEKTFSDAYHYLVCGRTDIIDSHDPSKALPIL